VNAPNQAARPDWVSRRLALARPEIAFSLAQDGRVVFRAEPAGELFADALLHRLGLVMGREFVANALEIEAERDGIVAKIKARPGDSLNVDAVILEFK